MKLFLKLLQIIYSVYALLIFVIFMFLFFPFVIIASAFGKVRGGNMIYTICTWWSDLALFLWGVFHKNIYEAPLAKDHAVVFVFNHISYIDIPIILKALRKKRIRVLGKAEMGRIPVFGFIYRNSAVMVDRESEEARLRSVRELKKVLAKDIAIVIAPEGTFNMTHQPLKEFYNGAFKIAVETGVPIQPVLLLDAYNRLNYKTIFSLTPGKSRAVFLPELEPGEDPLLLKEKVYHAMEAGLLKYKASWIQ